MLKIYGSPLCPDCVACKASFDQYDLPYEYHDITGSTAELKEFLALRDGSSVFDPVRENKGIGIPAIVIGDDIILDYEGWLIKRGYTPVPVTGRACKLDGTGC